MASKMLVIFLSLYLSAAEPPPLPDIDWDKVANIGKQAWKIIEDNKPAVQVTNLSTCGSAVPMGMTNWTDMEGWNPSQAQRYTIRIYTDDLFKVPLVEYTFSLSYLYGGSWQGKGHYIAELRLVPEQVWVAYFGGTTNAEVMITQVYNAGTREEPVAGISLLHRFTNTGPFVGHIMDETVMFVKGTGEVMCQSGAACRRQQLASKGKAGQIMV